MAVVGVCRTDWKGIVVADDGFGEIEGVYIAEQPARTIVKDIWRTKAARAMPPTNCHNFSTKP